MKNLIPCDLISLIREKLMNFINFNLINQNFQLILLCFPPAGGDDGERHKHGQTRRFQTRARPPAFRPLCQVRR